MSKGYAWNVISHLHQLVITISDAQMNAGKFSKPGIPSSTGSNTKRKKDTPASFVGNCLLHPITW
jgi:hypothetical protein